MLWSKQWATLPAMALRLRIREWRVRRGLSLRQLAARSGVQLSNLSRAERGQIDLRVSTLLLLAKALRVDQDSCCRSADKAPLVGGRKENVDGERRRKNLSEGQRLVDQLLRAV